MLSPYDHARHPPQPSSPRITLADLYPNRSLAKPVSFATRQGRTITPYRTTVTVVWVDTDRDAIHYRLGEDVRVEQTSISRFLEIVNYDGPYA